MDNPRILNNSNRSDRLLKSKLLILKKTLRVRGLEVKILRPTNQVFETVHGFNTIELPGGDRAEENSVRTARLVLNLNNLEHVGEKASSSQIVYHYEDIMNEGDIVMYRSNIYEYAFKVDKKSVYGELDFLYEYELSHFRVVRLSDYRVESLQYNEKLIDNQFLDHQSNPDWRARLDEFED